MSTTSATTAPSRRHTVLLVALRTVLLLMGLVGLAGAVFFSFFATPEEGGVVTAFDWFVAGWKMAVSLGFLAVAVAPGIARDRRLTLAAWLLVADVVFGLVKVFGYDETSSWSFMLVSLAVLGLVQLARTRQRMSSAT